MRYKVYTFRRSVEFRLFEFAYEAATVMIDCIKDDGYSKELWWACIEDQHKGVKMIVWLRGNYCYMKTQWLNL